MGKADEELPAPALPDSSAPRASGGNAGDRRCCCCARLRLSVGRLVRPRCVATLVLGLAVLVSTLFWLPPLLRHSGVADRDRMYGDIVARFKLQRPVNLLVDNIAKLQNDIFEEIEVPDSLVHVISLKPLARSNWTNVVFGVLPYKSSKLSSTSLSILRSSFVSLVMQQSTLHLTPFLFGNAPFFDVLKFTGGITITPQQNVFPLQKVQMVFNFTLNFPTYRVQDKISELKDQMKSGLLLNYNENLYVSLTNLEGSTVDPPTIVQTSVVLAVGNRLPSLPRWKQLAHNIKNSSAGNLGLNHTIFGRVKQIRLSSFLQHPPNVEAIDSPSPSPEPHLDHHHHHHLGHNYGVHLAPSPSPSKHDAKSLAPWGQYRHSKKPKHNAYIAPSMAPMTAPKISIAPLATPFHFASPPCGKCKHSSKPRHNAYIAPSVAPGTAPKILIAPVAAFHFASPRNSPNCYVSPVNAPEHSVAPSTRGEHLLTPHNHDHPPVLAPDIHPGSPLSAVSFSHVQPQSGSVADSKPPTRMPANAPSPYTSFATGNRCMGWIFVLLFHAFTSL